MRKKLLILSGLFLCCFGIILLTKHPALGLDGTDFCGSCHVMDEQVESYLHSAHRLDASCGDCHVPHSLVPGALYKSYTGTKDLIGVIMNKDPYEIRVSKLGKEVIQKNCLECHEGLFTYVGDTSRDGGRYCFECHKSTPHF